MKRPLDSLPSNTDTGLNNIDQKTNPQNMFWKPIAQATQRGITLQDWTREMKHDITRQQML
jgi:hypothetical protein